MSIITFDPRGLPVAEWRESGLTAAHRCWIDFDANNQALFHYQNPRPGHVKRELERVDQMGPQQLGLAIMRGEFPWRRLAIFLGIISALLVLCWVLTVMTGDPLAFMYVLVIFPIFVLGPIIVGFAIWRFVRMRKGGTHEGIEVFAAPWNELESFRVSDVKSVLGHTRRDEKGAELPPASILVADFGPGRTPLEISTWFNIGALNDMHGQLTAAFIDQRAGQLQQLHSAARTARHEAAGPRKKVV
jgi:hypothetical protein